MDGEGLPVVKTGEDNESGGLLEGCVPQELMNSSMHDNNEEAHQSMERKRKEPSEEVVGTDEPKSPDQVVHKKQRFIWSTDVHNRFLDAIRELGYKKAVPTKILALMNVEGLTRENVASHLQKYRLHVRKRNKEMYEGCALPDKGRENRSSVTSGIRNSRRSLVLPNPLVMQAAGEYTCFVQPQSVTSLSNQFGVYPTIQGIFHTPFTDMLSEKGAQVIDSGGLEHSFYNDYCSYEFSGPLPPSPLIESYGYSFLPQPGNLSVADQSITSPSVNQNMENLGGVIRSPRILGGGVLHSPRHGGLDGGVVHSPGQVALDGGVVHSPIHGRLDGVVHSPIHGGLDGGVVHSPIHGGLDGGVVHSPRHGGLDGGIMHSPRQGRLDGGIVHSQRHGGLDGGVVHSPRHGELDGGIMHSPRPGELDGGLVHSPRPGRLDGGVVHFPRPDGLDGEAVHLPRRGGLRGELVHSRRCGGLYGGAVHSQMEAPGFSVGAMHSPVEVPGLGGEALYYPVEVPGHGWGAVNFPVEAPVLAGGGMRFPVDGPGLNGGSMQYPAEAQGLAGEGGATCQGDAPGLAQENHLEDRNIDSNAHQSLSDAEKEFFSFDAGAESPFNWTNFIQDLEHTSIDYLFRSSR